MLRRVQCTFQRLGWLAVVPAAIALASCGGSVVDDGLTGPSVTGLSEVSRPSDTFSSSEKKPEKAKVVICHKGRDLEVASSAVNGHLQHGDALGSCAAPEVCPCFSAADIQAAASQCSSTVTRSCSTGDPYYLFLGCDPGGTVPPGVLGIYLTQTASGGLCQRDDVGGTFEQEGLTDAEYQACVVAINDSGYCF